MTWYSEQLGGWWGHKWRKEGKKGKNWSLDLLSLKCLPTRHPSGDLKRVVKMCKSEERGGLRYNFGSCWLIGGILNHGKKWDQQGRKIWGHKEKVASYILYKGDREEVIRELGGKLRECGVWKPREEYVCMFQQKEQSTLLTGGVRWGKHLLTLATRRFLETLMRSFHGMAERRIHTGMS